nr:hypothetical protein [uncultured Carboxylicivirga sp.]
MANFHPVIGLKNTPLNIKAKAGSTIKLDASGSEDPDGDKLYYRWWHYYEAGTYEGKTIEDFDSVKAKITVPDDAQPGETIHMICEVSDTGIPSLTRYQRVIITIID